MFGNRCEVKGQLNFRPTDGSDFGAPVNWFQGIYVYLATDPETEFDWSSGMDQNLALGVTKILETDGKFTVEFDLKKTKRDPSLAQGLQIGISLATHKEHNGQGTTDHHRIARWCLYNC